MDKSWVEWTKRWREIKPREQKGRERLGGEGKRKRMDGWTGCSTRQLVRWIARERDVETS